MRPRSTLHILIIDDDEHHGRSVKDVLAAHKYPADVATSGADGLAQLAVAYEEGKPYEVLILDLHMPDLSGLEILQAIRERGLKVKTVVLSGERELSSVAPILNLGAYDYLQKPFQVQGLLNSVSHALSAYQLEEENTRMQAEAEENARLHEFLLNASPNLIYMLDADGRFQFINRQLDGIFDADYDNLIDTQWRSLFTGHQDLTEQLADRFNERRTGIRATVAEEFTYKNEIGVNHALELSSMGLYDGRNQEHTGKFIGTYGVIRDITEARRTRQQLRQNQQKFYGLFVDSPDAVFISRVEDGLILEQNPNFVAIRQVMGDGEQNHDAFLWSDDNPRSRFVAGLLENPLRFDWNFQREVQGERRFFEIRARLLLIQGEACMLAILRDRTHERRAEQDRLTLQKQMQQAARMEAIGQVAGGIAHDFNNILASIIGYAELVQNARQRLNEDEVNKYLGEVVTAGHRARDLIAQMLTFTRAKRGETSAVDITQTISDVSRMLRAAIPQTISVDTHFAENLPQVTVDPIQIQQIIINLLINARDAISGNGRIDIRVMPNEAPGTCHTCEEQINSGGVTITVSDTGHGVPPEIMLHIFEIHFSTRAPDKGTGFGLWLINKLVHEHSGHIGLTSTVDEGTTFSIHLPPADGATVAEDFLNVPAPKMSGRIVVVDDEASVAAFIGEALRDKGYPTVVFTDSPQALDYLRNHLDEVALLLTDGSMPLISGLELVEYVRSASTELPIIYITGYTQSTDTSALPRLGVNTYLQKPFSIDEMLKAVAQHTASQSNTAIAQ